MIENFVLLTLAALSLIFLVLILFWMGRGGQYHHHRHHRIYVASSSKCITNHLPSVVEALRNAGNEVFCWTEHDDPRFPSDGNYQDPPEDVWRSWSSQQKIDWLATSSAQACFERDSFALVEWCDCVVLLAENAGVSAGIEAGVAVGAGKELYVVITDTAKPELLWLFAGPDNIVTSINELVIKLSENQ